jgi:hypothetical protein
MSKIFTPENVEARPDASYFSRERLAILKEIFEAFCKQENITSEVQRDELATNLLEAAKFTRDEQTLIAVMKYDIAAYRK